MSKTDHKEAISVNLCYIIRTNQYPLTDFKNCQNQSDLLRT